MLIDKIAYRSKILKTEPKAKIVFALIPLILCLCWNSFSVSIAVLLIMGAVTIKCSGISFFKYVVLLSIPLGFLLFSTITIVFTRLEQNTPAQIVFNLFGSRFGVTQNSLFYGIKLTLKSLGATSCMYFIGLNTPMPDIFDALRQFKIPEVFISLMELIYRYIFVFLEELGRMKVAQDARLGYTSFKNSLISWGQLFGSLFSRVSIRADNLYHALASRGYEGELKALRREMLFNDSKIMYAGCLLFSFILMAAGVLERGFFL